MFLKKWVELIGNPCYNGLQEESLMQGTLTVRLPARLKSDLYKLSQSEHVPVSDLVRESVRRYVAVRRFRKLRARLVPYAQAQGLLTDDDIVNALT